MRTKVAILGKLPTKMFAPFYLKDWDIWAFNYHKDERLLPRIDLWFDLHTFRPNPKADIKRKDFPFKAIEEMLGGQYINNSASYLIAYAILKGYEEIALYGMQFNSDRENRTKQYQNVREMIFFAKGKGIKVTAPRDEKMLEEYPLYGIT